MTQFTSFVAVEEMTITDGGVPRRVEVPIEMPDGVSREGVFGADVDEMASVGPKQKIFYSGKAGQTARAPQARRRMSGRVGGGGGGSGGGAGTANRMILAEPKKNENPAVKSDEGREAGGSDGSLSRDDQRRQEMLTKLHPSIVAIIERLVKKNSQPGPDEAKFIRAGKAEVQIWLTDKTPEALLQLKQLGFEVVLDPQTSKMVIGRLPVDKLAKLAELKFVRYVAPQLGSS
jgi:hypothetical protein